MLAIILNGKPIYMIMSHIDGKKEKNGTCKDDE